MSGRVSPDDPTGASDQPWGDFRKPPIRVALVNDYEVVATGVEQMLAPYADRVSVIRLNPLCGVRERVDIALYDNCVLGVPKEAIRSVLCSPLVKRTVIYTWTLRPEWIAEPGHRGIAGYLSKTLSALELLDALEQIHAGKMVVVPGAHAAAGGKRLGGQPALSPREAQVLALITKGFSNAEIAAAMFLTSNSIKSYIRSAYRKIRVTRRSQAVAWGIRSGFAVDYAELGHDAVSA